MNLVNTGPALMAVIDARAMAVMNMDATSVQPERVARNPAASVLELEVLAGALSRDGPSVRKKAVTSLNLAEKLEMPTISTPRKTVSEHASQRLTSLETQQKHQQGNIFVLIGLPSHGTKCVMVSRTVRRQN